MSARVLVNAGCGPRGGGRLPAMFESWRQLRVDIDPRVEPDVIADITNLSPLPTGSADALWSAHCLEHLFIHEVGTALGEFRRVLGDDGFACLVVPDLQTVAAEVVADRMHDVLYQAPAGPISAHDVFFGFGSAIANGQTHMAHRCGFTPTLLVNHLKSAGFAEFVVRRRTNYELAVVARKQPWPSMEARDALLRKLQL